jgi:hypothetical protein
MANLEAIPQQGTLSVSAAFDVGQALEPRSASNHAFAAHAGDIRQEEIAHRTAWAAVKRSYVKDGDHWVPIE